MSLRDKERLLLRFADLNAQGSISDSSLDRRDLRLFADRELGSAIRMAWRRNDREDFRFTMLRLMRDGPIDTALDIVRPIAKSSRASSHHRVLAVQILANVNDEGTLRAVANSIKRDPSKLSLPLAAQLSEELFPQYLTIDDLFAIIHATEKHKPQATEGFSYKLPRLYAELRSASDKADFVARLGRMILSPPFGQDYRRISKRYGSLADNLGPILRDQLRAVRARGLSRGLIDLLVAAERAEGVSSLDRNDEPLSEIVRRNPVVNRSLFWADVDEQRRNNKHSYPIHSVHQIYIPMGQPFWALTINDLDALKNDVRTRKNPDDKRVALTACVSLLLSSNSRPKTRRDLADLVSGDPDLEKELKMFTAPVKEDPQVAKMKSDSAAYREKQKRQEDKNKKSWLRFRDDLRRKPTILSAPASLRGWRDGLFRLKHLTDWLAAKTGREPRVAVLEWRLLSQPFSTSVAREYSNAMMGAWRVTKPEAPARTSGNGVTTKWTTILSFAGVGVEAAENPGWAETLSAKGVRVAARHACVSEQGYPDWLSDLLVAHQKIVLPIVAQRLRLEWVSTERAWREFLNHFSHPDVVVPPLIRETLLELFSTEEPGRSDAIEQALTIVEKLNPSEADLRTLATRAKSKLRSLKPMDPDQSRPLGYLKWLLAFQPATAVPELKRWIGRAPQRKQGEIAIRYIGGLFGHRFRSGGADLSHLSVPSLEALLHLVFLHVKPANDNQHEGVYSPDHRDNAESARSSIFSALANRIGFDAFEALVRASKSRVFGSGRKRLLEMAHEKAEREAEAPAWTPREVVHVEIQHTAPVKTGDDLFRVLVGIVGQINSDMHSNDITSRASAERAASEDEVRNWLVEQLNFRAKERFHAFREAQIAHRDRPDIIVAGSSTSAEVGVEVKHGGMGWTVTQLRDSLTTQLAKGYLQPANRRHGLFVLTNHHNLKTRIDPATGARLSFCSDDRATGRFSEDAHEQPNWENCRRRRRDRSSRGTASGPEAARREARHDQIGTGQASDKVHSQTGPLEIGAA
jgi:hypothetical protein